MKDTSKVRFVSDVEIPEKNLRAKAPFKINKENKRRFVRLEIQSPMGMRKVKTPDGSINTSEKGYPITGEILNISAGGILVETEKPLSEQDIVAMQFGLQEVEKLDNVLGLVKRVDEDEEVFLVGIEFITLEKLEDYLSKPELDLLKDSYGDFQNRIQEVLSKYLYQKPVTSHA